jgi:hypothetical protein
VNGNNRVIFVAFSSEGLEEIWDKPDFPTAEFGLNPHLTLYDGPDNELADYLFDELQLLGSIALNLPMDNIEVMGPGVDYQAQQRRGLERIFPSESMSFDLANKKLGELTFENQIDILNQLIQDLTIVLPTPLTSMPTAHLSASSAAKR